jgi:hypothetical protein
MRTLFLIAVTLFAANGAIAEDGEECFSKLTQHNICATARDCQSSITASLPMKMSENITLSMVSAAGPRVVNIAIWHKKKVDVDALLQAGGISVADLTARMNQGTRNSVCSDKVLSAFVWLGGQVEYIYKTEDGYIVLRPVVTAC